jgi:hypothetical protein
MTTPPENELLHKVAIELEALEQARERYSPQLAPDFSIFDYVDTSELGLSRILGDLLNPKGKHGQKDLFLRCFIERCLPNLDDNGWQEFKDNLSKTKIKLEERTWAIHSYRRMDIYLSQSAKFGICIENKPYTIDQKQQLVDYAMELETRRLQKFHLVYLNEKGVPHQDSLDEASKEKLEANKQISYVKYTELAKCLEYCVENIPNTDVSNFIRKLILFINKQFNGVNNMNEQQTIQDLIMKEANIKAAISISTQWEEKKKQLMEKLFNDLKRRAANTYNIEVTFNKSLTGGRLYEGFYFTRANNKEYSVKLEFYDYGFNKPALGVYFSNPVKNPSENINFENIRKCFEDGSFNTACQLVCPDTGHWPVWYWFQHKGEQSDDGCDWQNDADIWLMIQNDKIAEKIVKEVDALYQHLENAESAPK